jgi:NAD+ kinase
MRIFVLGNALKPGVREEADRLLPFLAAQCEVVAVDLVQQQDLGPLTADLALVLGGDGAILRAARQMGYRQVPVLGVNLGRLGFLADLSPEQLRACFPQVVAGQFRVSRQLMYECVVECPPRPRTFLGLNEVVVRTASGFHMIDLELAVDGELASRYSGDGLIVSTPTGSTGHNLSAGGPILGQELAAFVITPLCSHTLTSRPVVDAADRVYTITVCRAGDDAAAVVLDGQLTLPLSAQDRVTVRRAAVDFQLVKVPGHSYYRTLRDKLRWGAPPHYREAPS